MLHIRPRVIINCSTKENSTVDPLLADVLFDFFLPYSNTKTDLDLVDFLNLFFQAYSQYLQSQDKGLEKILNNNPSMSIETLLKESVAPINREVFFFLLQDQTNANMAFNVLKNMVQKKIDENNRLFARWSKENEKRLSRISKGRTPKSCPKRKRSAELKRENVNFQPNLKWLTQKYLFEMCNLLIRD